MSLGRGRLLSLIFSRPPLLGGRLGRMMLAVRNSYLASPERATEKYNDVSRSISGEKEWARVPVAPTHIGNKVWVGFGASVLKGVSIGEGAVVAAQSVVTRDVPPWTLVAGNPARVIRGISASRDEEGK